MHPGADTVAVNVKLVTGRGASAASAKALAAAPGVLRVEQTFPDEKDDELSTLYVLQVKRPLVRSALRALRAAPGVEYAEQAGRRRLVQTG